MLKKTYRDYEVITKTKGNLIIRGQDTYEVRNKVRNEFKIKDEEIIAVFIKENN